MKEEYDLSGSVKNPFIDSMKKNGYAVTVHYPPFEESLPWSHEEIVNNEMNAKNVVKHRTWILSKPSSSNLVTAAVDAQKKIEIKANI